MREQIRVRIVRMPRWQVVLIATLALALALAFLVLTVGLFLLVLPIVLVAGALAYLFGSRRAPGGRAEPYGGRVIEGEYREIDPERIDRERRN